MLRHRPSVLLRKLLVQLGYRLDRLDIDHERRHLGEQSLDRPLRRDDFSPSHIRPIQTCSWLCAGKEKSRSCASTRATPGLRVRYALNLLSAMPSKTSESPAAASARLRSSRCTAARATAAVARRRQVGKLLNLPLLLPGRRKALDRRLGALSRPGEWGGDDERGRLRKRISQAQSLLDPFSRKRNRVRPRSGQTCIPYAFRVPYQPDVFRMTFHHCAYALQSLARD